MRQNPIRLYLLGFLLFLGMAGLVIRLITVTQEQDMTAAGTRQGNYRLSVPLSSGTIYDRSMQPITNSEDVIYAVVAPTADTLASVFAKLRDRDAVTAQLTSVSPFVCELTEDAEPTDHLRILYGRRSRSGVLPAQHLIGYRQNGTGVDGLEYAFSDWLALCNSGANVTFTVSALGEVLAGADSKVIIDGTDGGGVVTTLDLQIQQITDTALAALSPKAGAAVVMDCKTGDILACSSTPVYDPEHLADSLQDVQSPFLNRALCAYNVGSVFKLVVASAALESDLTTGYSYVCSGETEIYGQVFHCHNLNGHGLLDMENAMVHSCNPYFISLCRLIPTQTLHGTAEALGFGQMIPLADGISSAAGLLPTESDLEIEAEKANLAFGQGQLLASPLQICAMTSCIANDGVYSVPRLVIGETADGVTLLRDEASAQRNVLSPDTAAAVRSMMIAVLTDEDHSNGRPRNTTAGGKTSTAQTGQYSEDGKEFCHAWMTGFFPADNPQYAVTVFAENGGSGNETAAPVFRRIIEEITRAS